jgi:enoyl-CoA hydratase
MQATFTKLETLRIPVIAAIQGGCIGGAVDMVTACCIRYATADAFFCIQEINIGMVADVGTLQRLPKLLPLGVVQGAGLHRPPPGRATRRWRTAWSTRCSTPRSHAGRRPAMRARNRRQAAGGHLGHQAGDPLRPRPQRGRFSLRQMGWVQSAIWSNAHVRESIMPP